jgi:hypothetical protein
MRVKKRSRVASSVSAAAKGPVRGAPSADDPCELCGAFFHPTVKIYRRPGCTCRCLSCHDANRDGCKPKAEPVTKRRPLPPVYCGYCRGRNLVHEGSDYLFGEGGNWRCLDCRPTWSERRAKKRREAAR